MAGPWEAYAPAQTAPATAGPWSQYAPQDDSDLPYAVVAPADQGAQPAPSQVPAQPQSSLGLLGTRLDQYGRSLAQGMTFGFGDEIAAAGDAATHALLGRGSDAGSYSERYAANLAAERAKDAAIPSAIAIPGQLIGGAAGIGTGALGAVAEGVGAGARMIPGANTLLDLASAGGAPVVNSLMRIPGVSRFVAPVVGAAAEGAAYGGLQGFGEGEGGFDQRLQSAERGAEAGAVLGPVVVGAGNLVARGVRGVGRAISEAGYGPRDQLLDVAGQPIVGRAGQPVVATPGVANVAARQLADATGDIPAAQAALAQPAELVPGSQPTTFQVTGDTGLGQKELELRNAPGSSQAFLDRANQQNAARVGAVAGIVPPDASSVDLVNSLGQQQAPLQAQQEAAAARAGQGTLQSLGGAAEGTPALSGMALRQSIDQARAPALQQAAAAVQQGQAGAQQAMDALGGNPPPGTDTATAAQAYGRQFRAVLSRGDQAARVNVSRLADAIDPEGTLTVNMQPARAAALAIRANIPANAAPLSGEEAAIFNTVAGLPDAQSFRELNALNSRVTTAMRVARQDPAQAQTYARLAQLRQGLADVMADTVNRPDVPVPAAPAASSSLATAPSVGSDVFTPSGQRIGVSYELTDAPSLITSHNPDFTPNPAFPPELQPRARDRAASEVQVARIAGQLQPERLGASSTVSDGAPIVGPDGVVESGNGRVMALRQAYQANGPQAQAYRNWLINQGHDIGGMQQPVLVRRRLTEMTPAERQAFAREGNAPTTLALSSTERAAGDAGRLSDDVLQLYRPGDVTDPANRDFVRSYLRNVVEPGQEGSFVAADGSLSQEGASRVRAALVHRAYGDTGLSAALSESTDPTARVLAGAMQDAAGPMAQLRSGIDAGAVDPKVDLAPALVEATRVVQQARQRGISLADAVGQRDAFDQMSPRAQAILRAAYGPQLAGRMSQERMASLLADYARRAQEQSAAGNLFGANLTADQLLEGVSARYGKATGTEGGVASGYAGSVGEGAGGLGYQGRGSVAGAGGQTAPGGGRGQSDGSRVLDQAPSTLTSNADAAAVERINVMRTAHAERKATFGPNVPGVGPVLAPGPIAGSFRMADSSVPGAVFSRGPGAAERVQAAIRAGLSPTQLADYAAFDLRRAAQSPDGTLDPAKAHRWRQQNAGAFQAMTRADPSIAGRFDTAQQMSARVAELQADRAAIEASHPLNPGWGDSEIMPRVWQPGPKGADSVRAALSGANGSPVAADSIADYAAYSLRKAAAPNGTLDPAKYQAWAKLYDGALSARPDIKAKFDTVAKAQEALDQAAQQHAQQLKDFQNSAARHFLGGADPADRIGQILNSATRVPAMRDLASLTANDPAARAGIQRAIVDHIFNRLQGNNPAGATGTEKLKSDAFQTFVDRAAPALREVMTPHQVDMLQQVAADLQRASLSTNGVLAGSGSPTAQKAVLLAHGDMGANVLRMLQTHGLTAAATLIGAKGGPIGAFLGNKAGAAIGSLRAAGVKQTSDLVTEAMLNPALAQTLLARVTSASREGARNAFVAQLAKLAAARGGHVAALITNDQRAPAPPPERGALIPYLDEAASPGTKLNSLLPYVGGGAVAPVVNRLLH